MDIVARLGLLFGLSFVSGINLYATIAVVGLSIKHHLVAGLPPELHVLANDGVIALAIFLYMIEFFMDKVPGLDTLWDALHTFIRPLGGALLGLLLAGHSTPALRVMGFMVGATLASMAHATKAGTRLVVNASPEPVSNIVISLGEDLGVIGLSYLALAHPVLTLFIVLLCVVGIVMLLPLLLRTLRMFFLGIFARLGLLADSRPGSAAIGSPFASVAMPGAQRERLLWSGRAYAVRLPHVAKFVRVEVVMTSAGIRILYRKGFKDRELGLGYASLRGNRLIRGKLFSRWVLTSDQGDWHLYLYRALAETLPIERNQEGRGHAQASVGR